MNRRNLTAALAAATLIGGGLGLAIAPAHGADKPTVSREFGKPLKAAQDDLKKGQYQEAIQELDKARALPKPTPYDTHVINELSWFAYYKTKDLRNATKAMEATLGDGFTPEAQQRERIQDIAVFYYQLNDFGKAAEFGERAIKGGFATPNTQLLVSQAYYQKGDYHNAYRVTEPLVSDEIKNGATPTESQLQIVLNSCVKIDNQTCTSHALEQLVTYHPKPEYWQDLMTSLFNSRQASSNDTDLLNVYRLAVDVGAMTMASQYIEMAQLALEQGSPGDAEQVLQQGYGKNVFSDPHDREHADRLLANAKRQAASDQSTLPKLATEASTAATGDKDVAVGMAYLGYQQYDKAADALSQGLMKGGVRNEAQAQLLLGIAELKAGRKADAIKTFHSVTGDPTLVRLAALWSLRAHGPAGTLASS